MGYLRTAEKHTVVIVECCKVELKWQYLGFLLWLVIMAL